MINLLYLYLMTQDIYTIIYIIGIPITWFICINVYLIVELYMKQIDHYINKEDLQFIFVLLPLICFFWPCLAIYVIGKSYCEILRYITKKIIKKGKIK